MKLKTIGTLFSGIGGVEVGAVAAGLTPVFAIDNDPEVCAVFNENFEHSCFCADAQSFDTSMLPHCDVLWASPPCQAWSNARSKHLLPRKDTHVGRAITRYIEALRPEVFILENVPYYHASSAFKNVCETLMGERYFYDWGLYEATYFGVPQTRKRLILYACRDLLPHLFTFEYQTTGWYEAIEDLIDTCPESPLAPFQQGRVPEDGDIIMDSQRNTTNRTLTIRKPTEPVFTICASHSRRLIRVRVNGVVRKVTTRGVARLQTFPDSYKLPEKNRIAWKGIGNAVPIPFQAILTIPNPNIPYDTRFESLHHWVKHIK